MARAIVRFSIQAGQVQLRNQIRHTLEAAGFSRIGTSSYEAPDLSLVEVSNALQAMIDQLAGARLDHFWIYVDQPDADPGI